MMSIVAISLAKWNDLVFVLADSVTDSSGVLISVPPWVCLLE